MRQSGVTARAMPESMEERIQREKRARYEQSDEYKAIVARKRKEQANIALASTTPVTEQDMVHEKEHAQGAPHRRHRH